MYKDYFANRLLLRLGVGLFCFTSTTVIAGHTNELLVAELDGREEVGDDPTQRLVGDPNGKGKGYVFGVDGDETTLCYSLLVNKIQLVPVGGGMAAHIHEGDRDTNGPVVAVLAGPEDGNAADCLTEGETGKFPTGEAGIVQRILNNPARFYINVHNPEFPAGAIRGNLSNTLMDDGHSHSALDVPDNLSSQVYSSTAAEIFWNRPASSSAIIGYEIYRDGIRLDMTDGPSYFDDSLASSTSYSYTVTAIDDVGGISAQSAAITLTTP